MVVLFKIIVRFKHTFETHRISGVYVQSIKMKTNDRRN